MDPEEPKLKSVKVILITANCSKSGITDPVRFLITEGEGLCREMCWLMEVGVFGEGEI